MTTIDQEAPATVADLLVNNDDAGTLPVIDCVQCGRNCRHTPKLAVGGGTAGSEKGTKFEPTPRSEIRCPACDGKPHRKEGRVYQEITCNYRQAMRALGSTELMHPNAAVYDKLAEMTRLGQIVKTPTETEINQLVRKHLGLPEPEKKARTKNSSEPVPQDKTKDEVVQGEAVEKIDGLDLTGIELPIPVVLRDAKAKLMEDSKPEDSESEAKAQEVKDAADARKAKKGKRKPKGETITIQSRGEDGELTSRTVPAHIVNGVLVPIEDEIAAPITTDEIEIEPGAQEEGDDYNPFAGVGGAFPEDDGEEDDLTDAQKAALGV